MLSSQMTGWANYFVVILHMTLVYEVRASHEKRLIRDLLKLYKSAGRVGRPVNDSNEGIDVEYGLSMIQILDLDERNQVLTTNVWGNYKWRDILLTWNPVDYGNVTTVRVPTSKIWLPDIKLYNYADTRLQELREALAVVYSDGTVMWIPQGIYKSSCSIDITHFPFDEQRCKMKFGSWTYDGAKLDVHFYDNGTGFDFGDYIESNEWDIKEFTAKKNIKKYNCCPEIYPDLTFSMVLKRKVAFYNYILILPCVLLSSLTLVLFWLPPESPAKMQLGMNIFVAFFVLLLLLAESTPPAATSIPLIGAYYCLNMILITLSTFLSVVVVNLYFHGNRSKVPRILKMIMIDFMARVMCMRSQVISLTADTFESTRLLSKTVKERSKQFREIKYDKVGSVDAHREDSPSWRVLTNGSVRTEMDTFLDKHQNMSSLVNLESEVREVKRHIQVMTDRIAEKDFNDKIGKEWKIVALVLDRMFFILYFCCIIVSIFTIFPKATFW